MDIKPTVVAEIGGTAIVGERIYHNYRVLGAPPAHCLMVATQTAIYWRMLWRAAVLAPFLMILLTCMPSVGWISWAFGDNPKPQPLAASVAYGSLFLLGWITLGIIYVVLVDRSLFDQRWLYRVFAPLARPFHGVGIVWLFTLPLWPDMLILGLGRWNNGHVWAYLQR